MSLLPKKLAFIDLETTGCRHSDRVIEVGILRVENNKLVQTYQSLVNPNMHVPDEIIEMTGISRAQLDNSPTFGQIKKDVLELLDDSVFVAHNARFDYSFIKNELKKEEITFRSRQLCTVKLSKVLFPNFRHHNLDSIIERFNFKCKNRHRAFDDAQILWEFWQLVQKSFDLDSLKKAINFVMKKPSVPLNLKQEQLDALPESSGVYIFYGKNGMPLYIGKSVNLRDRVLSHFSSDHMSHTELNISQQIESIEIIETSGELGALFKEADLIKKMQPMYNRLLRYSRQMVIIKKAKTKDGYFKITFDDANNIDTSNLEEVLGIFRNKKSAKLFLTNLAKEKKLCGKLLGVDTTNQACFGYRLGNCAGACLKKESTPKYNLRFLESFLHTKIRPWPFNGPILIKEENENGKSEGFLIDKWCYLGTIKSDPHVIASDNAAISKDLNFDLDTYKILLRFLSIPKNLKKVKQLNTTKKIQGDFYSIQNY